MPSGAPGAREAHEGVWNALRALRSNRNKRQEEGESSLRRRGARSARPRLLVGLGNPGPEYAGNRHNVGFRFVDRVASEHGFPSWWSTRRALVTEGQVAGQTLVLAKPQTFMNLSGESVKPLVSHFGVAIPDLMVVYDDLDLDLGTLRLRPHGGSGGHKGMQSIISSLGTQEFPRLRIGIDRPVHQDPVDYVLNDFTLDQSIEIERTLDRAMDTLMTWLKEGIEVAMNAHNAKRQAGQP